MQKEYAVKELHRQDINGWIQAYKGIDGIPAYREGVFVGSSNGYLECAYDIKNLILSLVKENPNALAADVLKLIKF